MARTTVTMPAQMITCLLCEKVFIRQALRDHIAHYHLNYVRHRCLDCEFTCVDPEEAFHHADSTGHDTVLNEVARNEYAECIMDRIYRDCVPNEKEKEEEGRSESDRHGGASNLIRDEIPPGVTVGDGEGVNESVTSNGGGPSLLPDTATQQVQPPMELSKEEKESDNPDKCQSCGAIVLDAKKRDHVMKEHMEVTTTCPVARCNYEVTADCHSAHERMQAHVRTKHGGYGALTDAEKLTSVRGKRERRGETKRILRECFETGNRAAGVKRPAPDQASSDGDSFQPKRPKDEGGGGAVRL